MSLSNEEKARVEAINYTFKTPGWKIIEEHFVKEIFDSVTKNATEKDIVFNAGIKEVFEYTKRKVSVLNK